MINTNRICDCSENNICDVSNILMTDGNNIFISNKIITTLKLDENAVSNFFNLNKKTYSDICALKLDLNSYLKRYEHIVGKDSIPKLINRCDTDIDYIDHLKSKTDKLVDDMDYLKKIIASSEIPNNFINKNSIPTKPTILTDTKLITGISDSNWKLNSDYISIDVNADVPKNTVIKTDLVKNLSDIDVYGVSSIYRNIDFFTIKLYSNDVKKMFDEAINYKWKIKWFCLKRG